ncbi:MAG: hypothetical protein V1722_03985 [Candidatus Micrarchaeota archaeon]
MVIAMQQSELVSKCKILLEAYRTGKLGNTQMPEDSNPGFADNEFEQQLTYFTLPMALNYQRDSYKLWQAALKTYRDSDTALVFDINEAASMDIAKLRDCLGKYKLALQPNKHTLTWQTICRTVAGKFGSLAGLFEQADFDYLKLKEIIQHKEKKGFPYLSGPKIFNYWSFIMRVYGKVNLKHAECIEIAPDTHVTQCSVLLGLVTQSEAQKMSKEELSARWRKTLENTGINPIDMHAPLWFWSRNNFAFKL